MSEQKKFMTDAQVEDAVKGLERPAPSEKYRQDLARLDLLAVLDRDPYQETRHGRQQEA